MTVSVSSIHVFKHIIIPFSIIWAWRFPILYSFFFYLNISLSKILIFFYRLRAATLHVLWCYAVSSNHLLWKHLETKEMYDQSIHTLLFIYLNSWFIYTWTLIYFISEILLHQFIWTVFMLTEWFLNLNSISNDKQSIYTHIWFFRTL